MLKSAKVGAAIPTQDLGRAIAWYSDKLGLKPDEETEATAVYNCGDGTGFILFLSSGKSDGSFTQVGFQVEDVDAEAAELKSRGLKFLDYDTPMFKTQDGLADLPDGRGGWFHDLDGNLISVIQRARVPAATS